PSAAFLHFREAANGGSAEALSALIVCYAEAIGTAQDFKQARECLEKSAALGNSSDMASLGLHLLRGSFDFPQDSEAAYQWFQRAAEFGNGPAQYHLSERSYGEKDFVRAAELCRQAAEANHLPALVTLASFHLQEDCGLKKEPQRISDLLRIALKLGYHHALPMLAHNDLTLVPSRNGVLSPVCAHGTTDDERSMAYTRFRLGDWGHVRTWEWDENDRRLSGTGILQGRYPLEGKPAILVSTQDRKSYFMCFEGERFDRPNWDEFWMGFLVNTLIQG
ncbi:MAG: sel1 repeat family protein, partial [Bdellovibrionales bacterium]|nr:sel1 repeat family protein [Bdellovibrionales bacterium]